MLIPTNHYIDVYIDSKIPNSIWFCFFELIIIINIYKSSCKLQEITIKKILMGISTF
uniref:Uncharacterized protein n=1 Tax=Grateloupia filicina TaxID=31455 RepID=A0A2S1FXG2_9FLOR|nr:hypothetical protein Grafi_p102 [Grateloupia filicina]AWD77451.1 hypothetical protein Grafi_p102 [Grateloupia filicina]